MAAGFKNCRRKLASVCAIGLLFVLSGCGTTKICLMPEQRCVLRELEQIDPRQDPIEINVDAEKATKWMAQGAQPSATVERLFRRVGILPDVR